MKITKIFNRFAQSARPEVKKSVLENMENKQRGNKQLNQQKTLTIDEATTKTSRIIKKNIQKMINSTPKSLKNLSKMEPRGSKNRIGARKMTQDSARQPQRGAMVIMVESRGSILEAKIDQHR